MFFIVIKYSYHAEMNNDHRLKLANSLLEAANTRRILKFTENVSSSCFEHCIQNDIIGALSKDDIQCISTCSTKFAAVRKIIANIVLQKSMEGK